MAERGGKVQTILLTGLPGVGRTSLLDHLLDTLPKSAHPATIVHRFAAALGVSDEPVVDGTPLRGKACLGQRYAEVFDFGSGSSCCAPDGALARELRRLTEAAGATHRTLTHLFVETTGMADPMHFERLFNSPEFADRFSLRAVVCLVSARDCASLQPGQPMHTRGLAQIRAADMVLNNVEGLETEEFAEEPAVLLRQFIQQYCPLAARVLRQQALRRGPGGSACEGFDWTDLDRELPEQRPSVWHGGSIPKPQVLLSEDLAQKFDRMLAVSMTAPQPAKALGKPPAMAAPRPSQVATSPRTSTALSTGSSAAVQPPPLPEKQPAGPRTAVGPRAAKTEAAPGSTAPPKHSNDGHDHDAEHEAATELWESTLLPPPPEVVLWTEGHYEKHDEDIMRIQGIKAVKWLVKALLAAWCSNELKIQGRRLLAVRAFTANLRFMHLWEEMVKVGSAAKEQTTLMPPIKAKLTELGHILEDNYNADSLRRRLGGLELPLHPLVEEQGQGQARQGLCVPNPPPGWHGQPAHRCEFAYLHVLLMLAGAVNKAFQTWCRDTLGDTISELQTPPIKSYGRMRNKMFSADDHRFKSSPRDDPTRARPEWNVDINRVLAVAHSPDSMVQAAKALSDTAGGVAKQKNGFKLEEEVAAMQYHLRLEMLSVLFRMPAADGSDRAMTYGELCRLPSVCEMWDAYARKPPQAGEAGCEWDADVAAARAFLESDQIAGVPVQIIAEIQMVLPLTCEVRHKMHELYKVARADTDKQLHLDFLAIADEEARKKQDRYDTATQLRRACMDGDLAEVSRRTELLRLADDGQTFGMVLDDAFIVACRHGQVAVVQMDIFTASRKRVGWKAADEVIDKCQRPSLEILKILVDNSDFSHDHTLMHTACRVGHTNVVDLLIKHAANINVQRKADGATPLYMASQFGHTTVVDHLLKASANHALCHASTDASPLYTAAESGHFWVVESLMTAKADIHHESRNRPPHLIAANNAHRDVVDLLMIEMDKAYTEKKRIAAQHKLQKSQDLQAKSAGRTGAGGPAGGRTSSTARKQQMARRKRQQVAEKNSGHVMHALAQQLKEIFTASGLTPERLFNTFEKDGDGEIGKVEFRLMLQSLGADIDTATIDDLFVMLDKDSGGDGEIDCEEFSQWFESELPSYAASSRLHLSRRPAVVQVESMLRGRVISMQQGKEVV